MLMKVKEAHEITGGLSVPSKMPCFGFSITAKACKTGGKLRDVVGSICSKCYALKGRYGFPNVQNALQSRLEKLTNPRWVNALAFLINRKEKSGFFRWHDSGDLQSVAHLRQIAEVCKLTPKITHWLPTREFSTVSEYIEKYGALPENLTVRLSALMFDGPAPEAIAKRLGLTTSGASAQDFSCPASKQGNKCLDCRACWSKDVKNINYKKH
jgi:hypothetical protein